MCVCWGGGGGLDRGSSPVVSGRAMQREGRAAPQKRGKGGNTEEGEGQQHNESDMERSRAFSRGQAGGGGGGVATICEDLLLKLKEVTQQHQIRNGGEGNQRAAKQADGASHRSRRAPGDTRRAARGSL